MIENLPEPEKVGGAVGLAGAGLMLLRWFLLRISRDAVQLHADSADRDAFARLQQRVADLDKRLVELEVDRRRYFAFIARAMAYIAQCGCANQSSPTKEELLAEYRLLIDEQWKGG